MYSGPTSSCGSSPGTQGALRLFCNIGSVSPLCHVRNEPLPEQFARSTGSRQCWCWQTSCFPAVAEQKVVSRATGPEPTETQEATAPPPPSPVQIVHWTSTPASGLSNGNQWMVMVQGGSIKEKECNIPSKYARPREVDADCTVMKSTSQGDNGGCQAQPDDAAVDSDRMQPPMKRKSSRMLESYDAKR